MSPSDSRRSVPRSAAGWRTMAMPNPGFPIPLGEFLLEDTRFPAVYFLLSRGEIVYVGQSRTLRARIDAHLTEGVKVFDAVAFIRCPVNRLTKIESHYIRELNPKYNACAVARKVRERESWCQDSARLPTARRRLSLLSAAPPDDEVRFVDAAECIVPDGGIGEFLRVSESDAAGWLAAGLIKDKSMLGLMIFAMENNRQVSRAQERFDRL